MNTHSPSIPERLAELNTQILELETERVELIRQELANAEMRTAEVSSFIGVYNASSASAPASSSPTPRKKRAKKTTRPAKKAKASPKKRGSRKASDAERLDKAVAVVKAAGKDGISAKQLSEKAGIPYSAVRKILSDSKLFRQKGEKRASRIFLK